MLILCNAVQPQKAASPIVVTDAGILILCNALQSMKAASPIVVTDAGMLILCNAVHPLKAPSPIVVTDAGILILCNAVQSSKASSPIVVTDAGILMCDAVFKQEIRLPVSEIRKLSIILKCLLSDRLICKLRHPMYLLIVDNQYYAAYTVEKLQWRWIYLLKREYLTLLTLFNKKSGGIIGDMGNKWMPY